MKRLLVAPEELLSIIRSKVNIYNALTIDSKPYCHNLFRAILVVILFSLIIEFLRSLINDEKKVIDSWCDKCLSYEVIELSQTFKVLKWNGLSVAKIWGYVQEYSYLLGFLSDRKHLFKVIRILTPDEIKQLMLKQEKLIIS